MNIPNSIKASKVLVFSFYDGATSGLLRGKSGQEDFYCLFELLAWDKKQDRRIFVGSDLAKEHFDFAVRHFSEKTPPKWPFWTPVTESTSASEFLHQQTERQVSYQFWMQDSGYFRDNVSLHRIPASCQVPQALFRIDPTDFQHWVKQLSDER